MQTPFKVVIPARYASTRLAAKALRPIIDRPMIQWVYEAASSSAADEVIVATDDSRIEQAVMDFGGRCCMTRDDHPSGTDRIVEVCSLMGWSDDTVVVNLQGDEPLMPAVNLTQVANNLVSSGSDMATLHKAINRSVAADPNQVKLVCDVNGQALYFSRSCIPFERDELVGDFHGHIGLYAYRVGFLRTYATLQPCMLEQSEKLEQLRALFNGYRIHTELAAETPGRGVDTDEDLRAVTLELEARRR